MPTKTARQQSLLAIALWSAAGALVLLGLIRTVENSSIFRGQAGGGITYFNADQTRAGIVVPADTDVILWCEGGSAFPVGDIRGFGWGYEYTMDEVTRGWRGLHYFSRSYIQEDPALAGYPQFTRITPGTFYFFRLHDAQEFACGTGFGVHPAAPSAGECDEGFQCVPFNAPFSCFIGPVAEAGTCAANGQTGMCKGCQLPAQPAAEASLLACTTGGENALIRHDAPFVSADGTNVAYTFTSSSSYRTENGDTADIFSNGYWHKLGTPGPRRVGKEVLDMEYNGPRLVVRRDDDTIEIINMDSGVSQPVGIQGKVGYAYIAGKFLTYTDVSGGENGGEPIVVRVLNLETGESAAIGGADPAYGRQGIVANAASVTFISGGMMRVYLPETGEYGEPSPAPAPQAYADTGWSDVTKLFNAEVMPLVTVGLEPSAEHPAGLPQQNFYLAGARRVSGNFEVFTMARFTVGGLKSVIAPQQNVYVHNLQTGELRLAGAEENSSCVFNPAGVPVFPGTSSSSSSMGAIAVDNINPDADGSSVPTGIYPIGGFRFTASEKRALPATITDLIFTVHAGNVRVNDERFSLYNKNNDTIHAPCYVVDGSGTDTMHVACEDLPDYLSSVVDPGGSLSVVLQADILDPKADASRSSFLQVQFTDFTNPSAAAIGSDQSHIRWIDGDGETGTEQWHLDHVPSGVQSTLYSY